MCAMIVMTGCANPLAIVLCYKYDEGGTAQPAFFVISLALGLPTISSSQVHPCPRERAQTIPSVFPTVTT